MEKQFGEHALKERAIYGWIQKAKLGLPMIKNSNHSGNRIDEQLLIIIQREIEKKRIFLCPLNYHNINAHPTLIYRYLTQLDLFFKHSRWIPHLLTFEHPVFEKSQICIEKMIYTIIWGFLELTL